MQTAVHIPHDVSYLDYKGKYTGIFSWIFSTDHKRIALLYKNLVIGTAKVPKEMVPYF